MRQISAFLLGLLALLIVGISAAQSNYPEKPIRLIVGLPPGSSADTVARVLGQRLTESLGKPVVVDNVQGAAGSIAADRMAKAAPDGYGLLFAGNGVVINPNLYKLAYDPIKDFAPIAQVTETSLVLVIHSAVAAKSVKELIALAKAKPGELTYASAGSLTLLSAELFKSMTGTDIREIRYKGVVSAIPDLLAGRITMMFGPITVVSPIMKEGKLRALAVTSLKRVSALPQLPTIDETGFPGFQATVWYGLLAPAKTPQPIIRRLHAETVNVLARSDVRARLSDQGFEVVGNSPDEFAAVMKSETSKWARLIKESGIKGDQ